MDCKVVMGILCNWANGTLVPWNLNCLTISAFSATEKCVFYSPFLAQKQGCHSENIKKEEITCELKFLAFFKKIMH